MCILHRSHMEDAVCIMQNSTHMKYYIQQCFQHYFAVKNHRQDHVNLKMNVYIDPTYTRDTYIRS